MSYTNGLDNPELYFQTKLYTGNGVSGTAITFDGSENMQPDWIWGSCRSHGDNNWISDSVRGNTKAIFSNTTGTEETSSERIKSFDSDGFTIGDAGDTNTNTRTFVTWNWKAGGSASSNSNGSITSSVSANQTAGFSIVSYTGTGSQATVGHGLGVAPSVLIHKKRTTSAEAWSVFHQSVGITKRMILSSTEAETADASPQPDWNDVLPTSSVFTIGTSPRTNASENYICYAFAEKKGYSKFGSYVANGNSDNTFVYTGFKVAFLMTKLSSTSGGSWEIVDSKRDGYNGENNRLYPNDNAAEGTGNDYDLLSNGFKVRQSGGSQQSGRTNIYMAFAEAPFVNSNGVPCNAR